MRKKGFTLIELVLAIAIAAIIIPGIIILSTQVISSNQRNSKHIMAVNQLKNAVNYITNDVQMAGWVVAGIDASGNHTLTLSWINYPNDQITVTYLLINGTLQRSYTDHDDNSQNNTEIIANNVNPASLRYDKSLNPDTMTQYLTINIAISDGTVSESRIFYVTPRSLQNNQLTPSAITGNSSPSIANAGDPVTFTADITPSLASGSVTFKATTTTGTNIYLGSGVLNSGRAVLTTSSIPADTYSMTAIYPGDTSYASSASAAWNLTILTVPTNPPTVTAISPNYGSAGGDTSVSISGTYFSNANAVFFGSTAAKSFTVNSSSSITAISPAGTGTVHITVSTPGGTSVTTSADLFTYGPTITGISPISGPTAGNTTVTVTGSGFFGGGTSSAVSFVNFGTSAGTILSVISDTSLTVKSPSGSTTVDITVTTSKGTSPTSSADQFTYEGTPTVTSVSPTAGPTTGGTSVTINGTNFIGATIVNFGGTSAASFTVNSSTKITATSPAGTGTIDIKVTTTSGTSAASANDRFTYVLSPTVTAVSPSAGPAAGGTPVTITGTNFTGATAVKFGSTAAASFTVNSSTSITATSPAGSGTVDVTVTTNGGTSQTTSADQFNYQGTPIVTNISPASGPTGGGTVVTVTGTNFASATTVKFGSTAGTSLTINSSTVITVVSPAGSGTVDITVTTPLGTSTANSNDRFTYQNGPTVTSISPNFGPAAGGTSVTITGANFTGASAVNFGSTATASFTVNSSTSITATSPAGKGKVDITVTTPTGTSAAVSADKFSYGPIVISINPISGPTAGNITVTVTGSGFFGGGASSVVTSVKFGTNVGTTLNVTSDTSLSIKSPSGSGIVDITVFTSNGNSPNSPADQFTYNSRSVTLNPISGPVGKSINVSGSGWAASETITSVTIDGTPVTFSLTVNSGGTLSGTIIIPSISTGSKTIVITGSSSGVQNFANAFRVLSATFVPTSGQAGINLTVSGSGWAAFETISSVTIGGTTATSTLTVNSSGALSGIVIVPSISTGAKDVVITGSSSGAQTFASAFRVLSATFNPISGLVGTNLTVTGAGWAASETISSVIVGGTTATNTLTVNSSGTLAGTITVPSNLSTGGATIVIIGSSSGTQSFTNAFTVTSESANFSPTSGPVGTIITVSGSGWVYSDTISSVTVGGTTATNTLTINNVGALSGTITVPSGLSTGAKEHHYYWLLQRRADLYQCLYRNSGDRRHCFYQRYCCCRQHANSNYFRDNTVRCAVDTNLSMAMVLNFRRHLQQYKRCHFQLLHDSINRCRSLYQGSGNRNRYLFGSKWSVPMSGR